VRRLLRFQNMRITWKAPVATVFDTARQMTCTAIAISWIKEIDLRRMLVLVLLDQRHDGMRGFTLPRHFLAAYRGWVYCFEDRGVDLGMVFISM
jgi:hypothetical protein